MVSDVGCVYSIGCIFFVVFTDACGKGVVLSVLELLFVWGCDVCLGVLGSVLLCGGGGDGEW